MNFGSRSLGSILLASPALLLAIVAATACTAVAVPHDDDGVLSIDGDPDGGVDPTADGGTGASSGGNSGGGGTAGSMTCVPKTVKQIFESQCLSCHGTLLAGGAPTHLVALSDLKRPSLASPTKTEAEASLARMQSTSNPMPPTGKLPASDSAVVQAWITAGMPAEACPGGTTGGGTDAGVGGIDAGGTSVDTPNYNTPVQCSTARTWGGGTGSSMDPGRNCNDCHNFGIAGTVYKTAHEPTNCYGTSGSSSGASVVITDANKKSYQLSVGPSGNFTASTSGIAKPYTVKVVANGQTRAMTMPITTAAMGECNSCHTQSGASNAPGRIMLP